LAAATDPEELGARCQFPDHGTPPRTKERLRPNMRAIVQDHYGSQWALELRDIDRPQIGDDDVLVRVHAASVHIGDWFLVRGAPRFLRLVTGLRKPTNRVPGTDIAGTIAAVGTSEAAPA